LMYSDPIRWSNLFQAYVMLTMLVDGHAQADLVAKDHELLAGMHELHESWLASADSRPPIGADRVSNC
uniref:PDEase domain-containing protein n=1 Tax=Macrostomum lignano TaxID=282301 RepID=A0A1I8JQL3_9PLAT